jgi:DNA-binding CsgD family transcriptional regulator
MIMDESFIEHIVIPYYSGYQHQDIIIGVMDLECRYIITSNKFAQLYGYQSWHQIANLHPEDIAKLSDSHRELFRRRTQMCQELAVPLEYLSYWENQFYYTTFSPLYYPSGQFFGIEFISLHCDTNWYMDLFVALHGLEPNRKVKTARTRQLSAELTAIQREVLFLLIIKNSQYEIAALLNRSRSMIKDIVSSLMEKFNVTTTRELIKAGVAKGFHRIIPDTLIKNNDILTNIHSDDILKLLRAHYDEMQLY